MDHEQSVIHAFRGILTNYEFAQANSFAEDFAQKRFRKKMEIPDLEKSNDRKSKAWTDFLSFDSNLPSSICLPPGNWYKARLTAHKALRHFRMGVLSITSGSEFTPTRGLNSLESKLARSSWDITRGNVDLFTELTLTERALKASVRRRFVRRVTKLGLNVKDVDRWLWKKFSTLYKDCKPGVIAKEIWRAKVVFITKYVEGSRFSTVRKNNDKDRPINVEPLCNILVQRAIGLGLRSLLKEEFGIDLENDQLKHRFLVATRVATIDLKDASSSVSKALCKFMLPKWFYEILEQARSPLILGPDHLYHNLNQISSMGNGFTFELMTFLLVCLGRVHSPQFSVYGDDIIVPNDKAKDLIKDLNAVGFVVNEGKSFIDSDFRESCGANFLDGHGYIESFDFEYPENIHDCITTFNKCVRLATVYTSFRKLKDNLLRAIPLALRGAQDHLLVTERARGPLDSELLSGWFKTGIREDTGVVPNSDNWRDVVWQFKIDNHIDFDEPVRFFWSFDFKQDLASATLQHLNPKMHWAKYFMYLQGIRKVDDVVRESGVWVKFLSIEVGRSAYRWKDLLKAVQTAES